mgnify:FL=1
MKLDRMIVCFSETIFLEMKQMTEPLKTIRMILTFLKKKNKSK